MKYFKAVGKLVSRNFKILCIRNSTDTKILFNKWLVFKIKVYIDWPGKEVAHMRGFHHLFISPIKYQKKKIILT